MILPKIEYDDGKPIQLKGKAADDRSLSCTPRGRQRGFYLRIENDEWKLPLGYMRVSEMDGLLEVFKAYAEHCQ